MNAIRSSRQILRWSLIGLVGAGWFASQRLRATPQDPYLIDPVAVEELLTYAMTSPEDLSYWFMEQQRRMGPLSPPDGEPFVVEGAPALLPMDASGFPDGFLKALIGEWSGGLAAYPLSITEDAKTRTRSFWNLAGEWVGEAAPPLGWAEEADDIPGAGQVMVATRLIAADLAPAAVALQEWETGAGGGMSMLMMTGATEQLRIARVFATNAVLYVTVAYPADYNGSVWEVYSFDEGASVFEGLDSRWVIAETNLVLTGTTCTTWLDTGQEARTPVLELTNRFYAAGYAGLDTDADTLCDAREVFVLKTQPNDADTDGDDMPDGWEVARGCDPLHHDGEEDPDKDGLTNAEEFGEGTDPFDYDTDDDLLADGPELTRYQTNPTNWDSDSDYVDDAYDSLMGDAWPGVAFQITSFMPASCGGVRIGFETTATTNRFDAYWETNLLAQTWKLAETAIAGGAGTTTWDDCGGSGRQLPYSTSYRVGLADDWDGDGVGASYEYMHLGTSPDMPDSDGDGVTDGNEDPDGDGKCNAAEYNSPVLGYHNACIRGSSNPWVMDSDGDGVSDGPIGNGGSITNGPDLFPLDPAGAYDSDCDGKPDYLHGTFASNSEPPLEEDDDDDNDGIPDASESGADALIPRTLALKKTVVIDPFTTTNRSMAVAAGFNGFSEKHNCMRLISNGVWELVLNLNQPTGFVFKFVSRGSFGQPHWGESGQSDFSIPMSDTAVTGSGNADIVVGNAAVGNVRFLFNESTLQYTVDFPSPHSYAGPEIFDVPSAGGYLPYAAGGNAQSGFGRIVGGIYFSHDDANLYVGVANAFVDPGSANENHLVVFLDTAPGGATSLSGFGGTPEAIGTANNLSFGSGFTPNVALVLGYDFGDGWNIRESPNDIGQGVYDISNGTTIADFTGFSSTSGGGKISQWGDRNGTGNAGMEVALSLAALGLSEGGVFKAAAIIAGGSGCGGGNRFFSTEAYGLSVSGSGCSAVTLAGADVYLSPSTAPDPMPITQPLFTDSDVMLQGFYFDVPVLVNGSHSWYRELRYKTENPSGSEFRPFSMIWLPPPQKAHFGQNDAGYAPFDYYDIGTYFQKSSTRTRYGTEAELLETVGALKMTHVKPVVDLVMNHMFSGTVTKFNFTYAPHDMFEKSDPGGNANKFFSDTGVTNAANEPFAHEQFFLVEGENTNYYPDVNHRHLYMRRGLENWGNWLSAKVGYEGYRFDVSQYIQPDFLAEFLATGVMKDRFAVFESWVTDNETSPREMQTWLGLTQNRALIYDGVLREMLTNMCNNGATFDIEHLRMAGLSGLAPGRTMNYVENHDTFRPRGGLGWTDPGKQGAGPHKHLAYAFVLLSEGLPMVFWPDYFAGIEQATSGSGFSGVTLSNQLVKLIWTRTNFVAGTSVYRSTANRSDLFIVERLGDGASRDGCLLAINDHPSISRSDSVSTHWVSKTLVNVANSADTITTDGGGQTTTIAVGPRSDKVYVEQSLYNSFGGPPL